MNIRSGNLQVYKVDKDNNKIVLGNVKFDLYSKDKQKVIGTYTTDENGEIYIQNLPIGEYKIIEKKTNKWYNLAEEKEIEIKWNETSNVTVENELKKGQLKVIKVDSEDNNIKLEGVEFNILDEEGNILETIVTDSKGEALSSQYAIRDYKTIYLQEVVTNEKYILDDEIKEIELQENNVKEVIIENEKIKGKIKIIKTSENYNKITKKEAGTPLRGVIFEIYNENNKLVETLKTNKDGIAITSELEKGEYKIKETLTNEWYYINKQETIVSIKENNEIVEVKVTNESKNPEVCIEKSGVDKAEVGSEIEYDISIKNSGNTTLDNFYFTDIIPSDYIKVTKFQTGTYNQNTQYNLYYKTNFSNDEYILMMEDLNSQENFEIDFEKELADNEYITEIKLEFKTVEIGFYSNENPHLFAKINSNVKSESTFTNIAEVGGKYNGYEVKDKSRWSTWAYKLLPKTGI